MESEGRAEFRRTAFIIWVVCESGGCPLARLALKGWFGWAEGELVLGDVIVGGA